MKAALTVTKDKKLVNQVTFNSSRFVIGRGNSCDLKLDEAMVSKNHVEILLDNGVYKLRDCGSRNGTQVNGRKIESTHILKAGDVITLGETELTFHADSQDEQATRVASLSSLGTDDVPAKKSSPKTSREIEIELRIIDGPFAGGKFKNWQGDFRIGRALKNDVVLLDENVSSEHARIVEEGEEYIIEDLKSANGTFVNGVKVLKQKLKSGDKIKAGVSVLSFKRVDSAEVRKQLYVVLAVVTFLAVAILGYQLLKPRDVAGEHVAAAKTDLQRGDLTGADKELQQALAVNAQHPEAKRLLRRVKELIEAEQLVAQAKDNAVRGDYAKAKDYCRRALTDDSSNKDALELQGVIRRIEQAEIAIEGKNWSDAAHLLEDAHNAYPASQLIVTRIKDVNSELAAEKSLAEAKKQMQYNQFDTAEILLRSIPPKSVFSAESTHLLAKINQDRTSAEALTKAQDLYRQGNLTQALEELDRVLPETPNNMDLKNFHDRVSKLSRLKEALQKFGSLNQDSIVDDLLAGRQACSDIEAAETDILNTVVIQTKTLHTSISQWLANRSQTDADQAEDLCKKAATMQDLVASQPQNARKATELFNEALKADPSNKATEQAAGRLRSEVTSKCSKLYQEAQAYDQDLHDQDKAKQQYQKILDLSVSGEHYYELARAWLDQHH